MRWCWRDVSLTLVGAVIGNHPVNSGDSVSGEKRPGASEKFERGGRFFIVENRCVGQAREPVHSRVQVGGVPDALLMDAFAGQGPLRASLVGTPATTVRDSPEFLHI